MKHEVCVDLQISLAHVYTAIDDLKKGLEILICSRLALFFEEKWLNCFKGHFIIEISQESTYIYK